MESHSPISSEEALRLCYFAAGMVKYLIPAQPPQHRWALLFDMLVDRIDDTRYTLTLTLDEAKGMVAEHMFSLICRTELDGDAWTMVPRDDYLYEEWASGWREYEAIFPDKLIESIAPYAPDTRLTTSWRVRRALEAVERKKANE